MKDEEMDQKIFRNHIMLALVDHTEEIEFYSKYNGKSLGNFQPREDMI